MLLAAQLVNGVTGVLAVLHVAGVNKSAQIATETKRSVPAMWTLAFVWTHQVGSQVLAILVGSMSPINYATLMEAMALAGKHPGGRLRNMLTQKGSMQQKRAVPVVKRLCCVKASRVSTMGVATVEFASALMVMVVINANMIPAP